MTIYYYIPWSYIDSNVLTIPGEQNYDPNFRIFDLDYSVDILIPERELPPSDDTDSKWP